MGLAAEKHYVDQTSPESNKPEQKPEELLGAPEPWESWESKLVWWSIGIGLVGLGILGVLINLFILGK